MSQFDLGGFLPYLLTQAAEGSGQDFQRLYKARYGILRTEWRVLAHLGQYGDMTAKEIVARANSHKTKVSRAVKALEAKRFLTRETVDSDRRSETLRLTPAGRKAYEDLARIALDYDANLLALLDAEEGRVLKSALEKLSRSRSSSSV